MRQLSTSFLIAALPVLLAGTGIAQAATETGCMTRSGTFIRFQDGDSPQRACNPDRGEQVVHFENRHNNHETYYNLEAVCNALDNVGAADPDLAAIGCPITPIVPGTQVDVIRVGQGSPIRFPPYESCGMKFEQRPEWGGGWHVTVYGTDDYTGAGGGAYVARTLQFDQLTADEDCKAVCTNDAKCVAARVDLRAVIGTGPVFSECKIFHHSDSVTVPYNEFCGLRPVGPTTDPLTCEQNVIVGSNHWFYRCDHL